MKTLFIAIAALAANSLSTVIAFAPPMYITVRRETPLSAAVRNTPPKYDKSTEKWEPTCEEDGYGPIGSLLRFGPVPFFRRLSSPQNYEQAVLKYQASERCDKMEAQGNMDAYFENVNDWTLQKLEEKNGSPKRDYASLDTMQVALTLTWAILITGVLTRITLLIASGEYASNMKGGGVILF